MRLAVIGCGAVAERCHLPALAQLKWSPSLLVDRDVARCQRLAAGHHCLTVSDDFRVHLGNFDAAIVAVPPAWHAPVCEQLLRRGIHVLVEKPMAATVADCNRLIESAGAGEAVLAVGLMRRFRRSLQVVRDLIAENVLGDIQAFDFSEGNVFDWPVASASFFRPESGGVLLDTGAHTLDLLVWWLGDVSQLEYRDDCRGGIETDCELRLTLDSGAAGVVTLSRCRPLRNTAILIGSKGQLEVHLHTGALKIELADSSPIAEAEIALKTPQTFLDLFTEQLRDWRGAIESGGNPKVTGCDARRSIRIIEECYRSRQTLTPAWAEWWDKPTDHQPLRGRTVLVTGGTGFIGGRLIERLQEREGCRVRALVRDFSKAPLLGRHSVEMVCGDLRNAAAIAEASLGCDVVFHLAHDFHDQQGSVEGARLVAEACLANGVQRLVCTSTISVYEPLPDGDVTESTPQVATDSEYTRAKRAVEEVLLRDNRERGLPVVLLQPTIVYGPFSKVWTLGPLHRLRRGRVALPSGGLCNPVYVDDVVQALILAATSEGVVGQRFLISGPEVVPWRRFYASYEDMLGIHGIVEVAADRLADLIHAAEKGIGCRLKLDPKEFVSALLPCWLKGILKRTVGRWLWQRVGDTFPPPMVLPNRQELALYTARTTVRIDRARRLLGYVPHYSLESGMKPTAQFAKWYNC